MKLTWRDLMAGALAVFGAVVMFAKIKSYTWWLIGSWKGALGVIAVTGLMIFALYAVDLAKKLTLTISAEMLLWAVAATVTIGSLFATTTKAQFIWSGSLIGLAWVAQLAAHAWGTTHSHDNTRYAQVH